MLSRKKPIHVVHILGSLKMGGVENWLLNLLRTTNPQDYRYTFIVAARTGTEIEQSFLSQGVNIHVCDVRNGLAAYVLNLYKAINSLGVVDVVHSHVHAFSSINLTVAAACRVPIRIAHSHTDRSAIEANTPVPRRIYLAIAKMILPLVMTQAIGVSEAAAQDLFGKASVLKGRARVIPCGVELKRFGRNPNSARIRERLGVRADEKCILHVGNFVQPKNHALATEIGIELCTKRNDIRIVFVGSGPLEGKIRKVVDASGHTDRFLFLGARSDVPELLGGLADAFVFPSLWEGLPVALVEAQAAGLPCVVSGAITSEAFAPGADVTPLSVEDGPTVWAVALESALQRGRRTGDVSRFDLAKTSADLFKIYHAASFTNAAGWRWS